jgi:hypothetical protein
MIESMEFAYPYHQAIGFLLERSGAYSNAQIQLFEAIPKQFNFWLLHEIDEPLYSERWRLFYPASLA